MNSGLARHGLFESFVLITPTVLTAAGMYWLGSGRAAGMTTQTSVAFLLFVPWQTLSLTVIKCGVDSWVLSRGGAWHGANLRLTPLVLRRYLPLTVLVGVVLLLRLPVLQSGVAVLSGLLDSVAMVMANELAAHGRVKAAAASNYFKYPLFFVLVLAVGAFVALDLQVLLGLFLFTSATRLVALLFLRLGQATVAGPWPATARLAAQQVLNYGLFKNDQLAMGITHRTEVGGDAVFVYLARFPELVSAVVTAVGPLWYPRLYPAGNGAAGSTLVPYRRVLQGAPIIIAAGLLYAVTAKASLSPAVWGLLPAVLVHAMLVLPVNYRTYALLREERESELVMSLLAGNILGVLLVIAAILLFAQLSPSVLWIIPAQQAVFLWRTRRRAARGGA
jgi:hypothetical protein